MPHQEELDQWEAQVSSHLGNMNQAFIRVLTLYAFGMALTQHCGQTLIAHFLGELLQVKPNTMRQRLRELTYESAAKRGPQRRELVVRQCFAPLLGWCLTYFDPQQRQIVLALDATYLRERFTILAVSVVVAGCAIPVAWHIQTGDAKGQWNPIWRTLLNDIRVAIPDTWMVSVLADGGLYSRALFQHIHHELHWHPHLRIGTQGLCREANGHWFPLAQLATRGMEPLMRTVICFKGKPVRGTVLVEWDAQYDKPCLVLTDLPPKQARHETYHLRFWIEAGFKDLKRGGLRWEQTKMRDPQRVERLWLVMSVALLYLVSAGLTAEHIRLPTLYRRGQHLSGLKRGWIMRLVHLITQRPVPQPVSFGYAPSSVPIPKDTYP